MMTGEENGPANYGAISEPKMNMAGYPPGPGGQPYPPGQPGGYNQGQPGPYPQGQPGSYPQGQPGAPYPQGQPQGQPGFPGGPPPNPPVTSENTQASAPPLEDMDKVPGYENVNFGGAVLPPPPSQPPAAAPDDRRPPSNVPLLSEDTARAALLEHVADHCCYGKAPAEELQFLDLKSTSAFHYQLDSFTESRNTAWTHEPYNGQPVDGPFNGPAPGPWDIQVMPAKKFTDATQFIEIPHTASVKPCHLCVGIGRIRCKQCIGNGQIRCSSCHGRCHQEYYEFGERRHRSCMSCNGDGHRRCYNCSGTGQIRCDTCDGRGQLKCYIRLTVTWKNHREDFVSDTTSLPNELIIGSTGQMAFQEEYPRVYPVNHFPDQAINSASRQLVTKHNTAFPMEKIHLQKHMVRIIPITEAVYSWKDTNSNYFVYGFESQVYAPHYPQKCCWGCTIL